MKSLLANIALLLLLIYSKSAFAQNANSHSFDINISDFKNKIKNTPKGINISQMEVLADKNPDEITLPLPDGRLKTFKIIQSEVMADNLKAQFPDINSYRIFSKNKKDNIYGTLTVSESGIHAFLFTPDGEVLINPEKAYSGRHTSNFQSLGAVANACGLGPEHILKNVNSKSKVAGIQASNGAIIKTYRMAIITTGEFYVANGGTVSSTQTAVVSIINALKAVYEKELSVSLNLVSAHIYSDPATDPFNGSNATTAAIAFGTLASSNPTGFALGNYDLGQVLHHSPGGGGVAYIGAVCNNFNVSSATSPVKAVVTVVSLLAILALWYMRWAINLGQGIRLIVFLVVVVETFLITQL